MPTNALSIMSRVSALACGGRMKKALALVAEGTPYRDALEPPGEY